MTQAKQTRRKIRTTNKFKRDIKRIKKRGKDIRKIRNAVERLASGESLGPSYRVHPLKGSRGGFWECHLEGDWLLIWKYDRTSVELARTGTHSDLFKCSK